MGVTTGEEDTNLRKEAIRLSDYRMTQTLSQPGATTGWPAEMLSKSLYGLTSS